MRKLFVVVAALMATSCSTSNDQKATALTNTATACHVVDAAEAADPVFVAHNPNLVAGVSTICALAPVAILSAPTSK